MSAPGPDEGIRRAALSSLIDAYGGGNYRLLVDLGYALGLSVAYVDRQTVEAHLERNLTGPQWSRVNAQFRPMDFDDHVGDLGQCRTEWIDTVLARAGIDNGHPAAITPPAAGGAP